MGPGGEARDGIEHVLGGEGGAFFESLGVGFEGEGEGGEDYGVGGGFPAVEGDDVLGGAWGVGVEVGEDAGFGFEDGVGVPARGFLYR